MASLKWIFPNAVFLFLFVCLLCNGKSSHCVPALHVKSYASFCVVMWHDVGKIIANLETNKIAPTICQCDRINAECVCVSVWPSIWPIDLLFVLQLTLEMTHTHEPTFRSFKWKTTSSCMKTWRKNAHTKWNVWM